ncbi:MAG: class I SAM-dependent methyltransferase [bacterium]|nr:class I SAM-dependent methyltransferase [bacterium]
MQKEEIYTKDDVKNTYNKVYDLLVTKHIIKTYSTNREDVREVALHHLDLTRSKNILELGCGYGFFIEKLKGRLHSEAEITGIDLVSNNREVYLNSVHSTGYAGKFIEGSTDLIRSIDDSTYDLIIACYSLYFFPHLIDEIARLLTPNGLFVAVTHSKFSLKEAIEFIPGSMEQIGLPRPEQTMLNKLFMAFSQEDGSNLLEPYFDRIEMLKFKNEMVFPLENIDDCIYYIEKKRHLIYKEVLDMYPDRIPDLEAALSQTVFACAKEHGLISLNKNDGIFRCYKT